jgi:hypothetical protein
VQRNIVRVVNERLKIGEHNDRAAMSERDGELRSVDVDRGSGVRSIAKLRRDGGVDLETSGPHDAGMRGEPHVARILVGQLVSLGRKVEVIEGALDCRGEDLLLRVDGAHRVLQVTTIPPSREYWANARMSSAKTSVVQRDAVAWIRSAAEKKARVAARDSTILTIDARYAAVVVGPAIAGAYRERYGSPSAEFGFAEAWIVGTASHCTQL